MASLSFREFLLFTNKIAFDPVKMEEIIQGHRNLTRKITDRFRPLPAFQKYLQVGYLPIIAKEEDLYLLKLNQVINTIVDTDLAYIATYNTGTATKVKEPLGVIAESVPFKPNIAA